MSRLSQTGDYASLVNPQQKHAAAATADEFPLRAEPPVPETTKTENEKPTEIGAIDGWSLRNGHGLTFIALFFFSIVLYFRPYELIPALSPFSQMAFFFGILTLAIYVPSQLVLEG